MNISQEPLRSIQEKTESFTFKAAVIESPRTIKFVEISEKECGEEELLIRMEGVGLCASNIPVWEGREWFEYPLAPGLPGHEGWGRIEKKGARVSDFEIGQRVALLQNNSFAEYIKIPASHVVKMPGFMNELPFPGEAFGCLMNIFDRADIQKGQTVAIIGLGFIGLGLIKLCKEKGAKILAISRRDSSLQWAARDADVCIKMEDHSQIVNIIQTHTHGKGCERVIECTGKQWPLDLATDAIGNYGKLIIAGYHQDGLRKVNLQQWNWKAIEVINAHERDPGKYKQGIKSAIEAIRVGLIKPEELLTHQFPFNALPEALDLLTACPEGFIKGYIKF